jgi:hypothetical protein
MKRACGDCQLCCRLVPVPSIGKDGGVRCKHQKFGKGCAVYHRHGMPPECSLWNCRWLVNDDTADLSRPDRSHYVIDIMPDFVTLRPNDGGEPQTIQVAQVWVDPKHPDAHRDPALRRWMERRAEQGIAAIVRFNPKDAIVIFAPPFDADRGEWHEVTSGVPQKSHTFDEITNALGGQARIVLTD